MWRNVSAVKRCKSLTDSLTDFKLGENYINAKSNTFKNIRSNRWEINIRQILDLYSDIQTPAAHHTHYSKLFWQIGQLWNIRGF